MPRNRRGWSINNAGNDLSTHTPLRLALLEPILLVLIKQRPRHGYSLLSDLEAYNLTTVHPGVVYRTLRDLEDLGWITSQWDADETQGPPRRKYNLTPQGETALGNWQTEMQEIQHLISDLLKQ